MAGLRSVVYVAMLTVPATASAELDATQLLRDILPDEAFRIHSLIVSLRHSLDLADRADVTLAKNITPVPGVTAEAVVATHGVFARFEHVGTAAAGSMSGENWVVPLPTPLDFDRNDSINLRVVGANSAATSQQVYAILTMHYEVG